MRYFPGSALLPLGLAILTIGSSGALASADDSAPEPSPVSTADLKSDPGALVVPGRAFGMRKGDIIEEIDGQPTPDKIKAQERLLKEGSHVREIKVKRAGKLLTLKRRTGGDPR